MRRRDFLIGAAISGGALASGVRPGTGKAAEGKAFRNIEAEDNFRGIDCFSHFVPISYLDYLQFLGGPPNSLRAFAMAVPEHSDVQGLDPRLQMMEDERIDVAIIFPQPDIEGGLGPAQFMVRGQATQAAQFINNYMSNLCTTTKKKFKFAALVPMNSKADMTAEFDRVMALPGVVGVGFNVGPTSAPPDSDVHMAMYEKAVQYDVPVWMHFNRGATVPDYNGDPVMPSPPFPPNTRLSYDYIWVNFGFLLDGTAAMMRIVAADVFDKYPGLKLIAHQRGNLIPLYVDRIRMHFEVFQGIFPPPVGMPAGFDVDHFMAQFPKFYVDAICSGQDTDLLTRSVNFFGANKVMFATDTAYSPGGGRWVAEMSRKSILGLQVTDKEMEGIFAKNIINLVPSRLWNR